MEYQYIKIANKLEQEIQAGVYLAGDKLPSLRKLRAATGRSISTVYQAYEELENRGLVEVREKSGFFARPLLNDILPLPKQGISPIKSHKVAINVLSSMMQRSLTNPDLIPFGEAPLTPLSFRESKWQLLCVLLLWDTRMGVLVATVRPRAARN